MRVEAKQYGEGEADVPRQPEETPLQPGDDPVPLPPPRPVSPPQPVDGLR